MFTHGHIPDVIVRGIRKYHDSRGWLAEMFRSDQLPPEHYPVMGYISATMPGVARGPHEHAGQTDAFCFLGPSTFKVYLWDARPGSSTRNTRQVLLAGEESPLFVLIPPGVVHAYRNVGAVPGLVVNLPNRLYRGEGGREPVDEIRHESDPHSPYLLD